MDHIIGHNRTNTRSAGKEEINDIDFVPILILSNCFSALIDQFKIGNGMVFISTLHTFIDQSWIEI